MNESDCNIDASQMAKFVQAKSKLRVADWEPVQGGPSDVAGGSTKVWCRENSC